MFRYCTSNGCNIQDGSIYSEGNLDPPQTEPPETEAPEPEDLTDLVTEVEEEEPALVIEFGPDEPEESSSSMTIQSLFLAILLLCVNF